MRVLYTYACVAPVNAVIKVMDWPGEPHAVARVVATWQMMAEMDRAVRPSSTYNVCVCVCMCVCVHM